MRYKTPAHYADPTDLTGQVAVREVDHDTPRFDEDAREAARSIAAAKRRAKRPGKAWKQAK